ncbi:MAG: hypothetical protein ABH841_02210 [Candidatus Nealsonbacteria bacterium]
MLLTPHILIGVAIITLVRNPILGLIFVLLSHYFLDLFPQKEYTIKTIKAGQWSKSFFDFSKVFLDIFLGLTIIFFITGYSYLILTAVFASLIPDGLTLLHCIFPKNRLLKKHMKIHGAINAVCENKKIPVFWGIASQAAAIAAAIYFLIQPQILL